MRFGLRTGDENHSRRRRDGFAGRLRNRASGRRRFRQRSAQHQATDTAIADTGLVCAAVREGCGAAGEIRVTDNAARLRRGGNRHLRAGEIGEQARESNRIGGRKRNQTLLQQPLAEKLVHRP